MDSLYFNVWFLVKISLSYLIVTMKNLCALFWGHRVLTPIGFYRGLIISSLKQRAMIAGNWSSEGH